MSTPSTTLINAGYIIAFADGGHRLLAAGSVLLSGNRIKYVGPRIEVEADAVYDLPSHIVSPGFISTHGHLAASPFERGVREDWTNPYLYFTGLYEHAIVIGQGCDEAAARIATVASMSEMLHSGVTTAVDLTAWPQVTEAAAREAGQRVVIGQFFRSRSWETDGRTVTYRDLEEEREREQYDSALAFTIKHREPDDTVTALLAPAQLDTCRPQLLREAHSKAIELGVKMQTHAAQSVVEFRQMLASTGRTPVQYMADLGILDESLIIGHCVFLGGHSAVGYPKTDDLTLLVQSGASIAHCPWVFARYGQGLESLGEYLSAGVRVSIGLDTVPQSMLNEFRAGAIAGKILSPNPQQVTALDLFNAATLGGADALGRPELGRIAEECAADLVAYNVRSPAMTPLRDPIKNIVYSASPADVDYVWVDGKLVIDSARLLTLDDESVAEQLQHASERVWARFPEFDHAGRKLDEMTPVSIPDWV